MTRPPPRSSPRCASLDRVRKGLVRETVRPPAPDPLSDRSERPVVDRLCDEAPFPRYVGRAACVTRCSSPSQSRARCHLLRRRCRSQALRPLDRGRIVSLSRSMTGAHGCWSSLSKQQYRAGRRPCTRPIPVARASLCARVCDAVESLLMEDRTELVYEPRFKLEMAQAKTGRRLAQGEGGRPGRNPIWGVRPVISLRSLAPGPCPKSAGRMLMIDQCDRCACPMGAHRASAWFDLG